jgi:hypothetical protein
MTRGVCQAMSWLKLVWLEPAAAPVVVWLGVTNGWPKPAWFGDALQAAADVQ